MPSCPSCSRAVAVGVPFCGYCGAAIGGPAPGVRRSLAADGALPSCWTCPLCSVENTAETQFCRSCGASRAVPADTAVAPPPIVSTPRWRCAGCNQVNDPAAQFSYYCGAPAVTVVASAAKASPAPSTSAAAPAPPTLRPTSPAVGVAPVPAATRSGGMSAGVWLVVAGGLLVFAMSFVAWGAYSENLGGGWSPWNWQFDVGVYQWTGLWPPNFPDFAAYEGWRGWPAPGLYVASMLMTVLCVIAAIQALRRGLAGAAVSGSVLRGFGIAALVVFIMLAVYWATPQTGAACTSATWR